MSMFLSYSRQDGAIVAKLRTELEDMRGISVWMDNRLAGGQDWWSEILEAIRSAELFVLALSRSSLLSEACISERAMRSRSGDRCCRSWSVPWIWGRYPTNSPGCKQLPTSSQRSMRFANWREHCSANRARPHSRNPSLRRRRCRAIMATATVADLRASAMTLDEQIELAAVLKVHSGDPVHGIDATDLLRMLRDRHDVAFRVAQDIDSFLVAPLSVNSLATPSTAVTPAPAAPTARTPQLFVPPLHAPSAAVAGMAPAEGATGEWEQCLIEILLPYACADLYVVPNIPPAKLQRARDTTGTPVDERVVALLDCTVFGSAAEAVLFTLTGTYHRHSQLPGTGLLAMSYQDWPGTTVEVTTFGVKSNAGAWLFRLNGSAVQGKTFVAMMNAIATRFTALNN